jgi:hypothetical protein
VESPIASPRKVRRPAYRRIAEGLRAEIASGKLAPGTQLPSTDELAAIWQSSTFTIHSALVTLVKEGWVERLNGEGTYVAEAQNRFTCAAIYHGVDICSNEHPAFLRSLHGSVLKRLGALEKGAEIFIDPRPLEAQGTVLPALAEAISHRRVQCLIGSTINDINSPALAKLTVPVAFSSNLAELNHADFDRRDFFQQSVRRLAAQGCKSIGLITNVPKCDAGSESEVFDDVFHDLFQQAVREEKLSTRDEWVLSPEQHVVKLSQYGYDQFHKLWRLTEKPDGVIVYVDGVAMGATTAILEIGVRAVTEQMKFVFHRNAQLDFLCPFPVTWAISDEDRLADGLVELIQKQFDGEKTKRILVPYRWE